MRKSDIKNKVANWAKNLLPDDEGVNPALLFIKSDATEMPQIYLFSKFGLAQGAEIGQQSQITTHYTEKNNAINDHWAISPMTVSLSGLIGEVIYTPPKQWANIVAAVVSKMQKLLKLVAPKLNVSTGKAYNIAQFVESNVRRYLQIIMQLLNSMAGFGTLETNQQYVFRLLRDLQLNRQLMAIETPYGAFEDMAIVNVRMSQNGNRFYSELIVDFQEWRNVLPAQQRAATQAEKDDIAAVQQELEQQQGEASTTSVDKESHLYIATGRPTYLNKFDRK